MPLAPGHYSLTGSRKHAGLSAHQCPSDNKLLRFTVNCQPVRAISHDEQTIRGYEEKVKDGFNETAAFTQPSNEMTPSHLTN